VRADTRDVQFARDVRHDGCRPSPVSHDAVGRLVQLRLAAGRKHNSRPAPCRHFGGCQADTTRGAGDYDHLLVEFLELFHAPAGAKPTPMRA
jgi:hypothetical protein